MTDDLRTCFGQQHFANGYELVDGVVMHETLGGQFAVPPDVLKRHVRRGHFVELRVDSPRFSVHEADAEHCSCPSCSGPMTNPVLSHTEPASLAPIPPQSVPSRGWGEDFWVEVTDVENETFRGRVDNPLIESRLHEITQDNEILFLDRHILTIHPSHRQEMITGMDETDIRALVLWLGTLPD